MNSLLPGEDPRVAVCAAFYRQTFDEIRGRLARGEYFGRALGRTLLFPKPPPRPPSRSA